MPAPRPFAVASLILGLMATCAKGDPIGSGGGNSLGNLLFGATVTSGSTSGGLDGFSSTFSTPIAWTPTISVAAPVAPTPSAAPAAPVADGFINFGSGPYPDAALIATGNPQAWASSPKVDALFGGVPNAAQQAAFTNAVLQITQQAFQQSGVNVNLTTNPNVAAAHTLSVVSNSSSVPFPTSIGSTEIGGNGFSFIDQEAQVASSVGQLEMIVAHNVAHELMLAFGVPEQYDQTGNYIDATHASWSMITSPSATFSPSAAQAINQALQAAGSGEGTTPYAQFVNPQVVPEPATLAAWGLGLLALAAGRRARGKRAAAV